MPPSHTPQEPQPSHIKAIGNVLRVRRIAMDPTHHHKRDGWVETVKKETGLDRPERTVIDLETGARTPDPDKDKVGYGASTLAAMEKAYKLRPGTLAEALWGGQLVAEDGEVLYPPPPPEEIPDPDRFVSVQRRDDITGRVVSLVRDLDESTRDMDPEEASAAVRRALDAARLWMEAEQRGRADPTPDSGDS